MENREKLELIKNIFAEQAMGTVGSRIYATLKRAIVQLILSPGYELSEADVAKMFGVSRQPVREAFIKLAEVGLLDIRPQRGTYVRMISRKDVENVRFMREAIEVALVRKAAELQPEALIKELRKIVALQELAWKHEDNAEFLRLDELFHSTIAEGIECDLGWRLVMDMKAQMDRVRYLSLDEATPISALIEQHKVIVDVIEVGNAHAAQGHMEIHLREILKSLPQIQKNNKQLFCD
ncbi:GntR family transcriptional regulator [Rhodobacteraceae bacterium RKSG542]|uniref:GntR family transcriptional regulator n=1 Tax=Pseudovibrio flavus TaxID=2529854 RepID=UPI0012BB8F9E|nr:GntR family transcriptional regulator [Pseudovibrio flavus]MTI17677.1 GntR family transcriptional regulator [Pseudovibrio flavus]